MSLEIGASTTVANLPEAASPPVGYRRIVKVMLRDPFGVLGTLLVLLLVFLAAVGPWIAPYPDQGRGEADISSRGLPPSLEHWFGTDDLGRDVLSRVIFGARPALLVSLGVVVVAVLIGVTLGAVAGYRSGWADESLMRVTEVFQSFPPLLLAMVAVTLLGPGLVNAGIALALSWWTWYARLARAEARSLRNRSFVEAARSMGVPTRTILGRHVVRNSISPILVQSTVDIGTVILAAGALAFVGLGAQPPSPDWGLMVAEGRASIFSAWWISTFPGLAIFLAVLGFNLMGDALRDVLDPRSVGR